MSKIHDVIVTVNYKSICEDNKISKYIVETTKVDNNIVKADIHAGFIKFILEIFEKFAICKEHQNIILDNIFDVHKAFDPILDKEISQLRETPEFTCKLIIRAL